VYYWQLPPQFDGDKVTSYGGHLNYTVRYVPTPGGQSSRNNAPDVELISENDIRLLYFGRDHQIEPNRPQSISVPMVETVWQRHDGQIPNREHFLMALADVETILIKATYTTNTREAALIQVSLDVAEDRNTGQARALEVEQCQCPIGYRGLSCEDCEVGYTRTEGGLYLGTCEPCQCYGHSNECDPETGICMNCADHTTGDQCDICEEGYTGDPTQGTCRPTGTVPQCRCDSRGSTRSDCPDGVQCICKTNVGGRNCDRCRPGTFSLSEKHIEGCLECFCSGVTDACQQANLYRTQIPMQVIDSSHGFTLTDRNRNQVIRDGFRVNERNNEIEYEFPPGRSQSLFWSLPPAFTGNRITSYGGNLTVTQLYRTRPGAVPSSDTDVIIYGSGISVYWTSPEGIPPDRSVNFTLLLSESAWRRLDQVAGQRPASRADILTILTDVEAILSASTHIVTNSKHLPSLIECRCPPGFKEHPVAVLPLVIIGSMPVPAHFGVHQMALMAMKKAVLIKCGRVTFKCSELHRNYCDSGGLQVEIYPLRVNCAIGTQVDFRCSYRSVEDLDIHFEEIFSKTAPLRRIANIIEKDDRGADSVYQLWVHADHQALKCSVSNREGHVMGVMTALINQKKVEGETTPYPYPIPTRDTTIDHRPTIIVTVSEPTIQIVDVGSTVRYSCDDEHEIPVTLEWSKEGGDLPRDRAIDDRRGMLVIKDVRVSDSGTYICSARDGHSIVTERVTLTVGGSPPSAPLVTILPRYLEVNEGSPVEFRCEATGNPAPTLRWNIGGNKLMNPQSSFSNGIFRIPAARKSDESDYECVATNPSGTGVQRTVLYVTEGPSPGQDVQLTVNPPNYEGPGGQTIQLNCLVGQDIGSYTIRWSRTNNQDLPSNAVQRDGILTIYNASPADSDIYVCTATQRTTGAISQVQARVTIISTSAPPVVRIEPETQTISQGTVGELRCIATGDPSPTIRWSKSNEELGSNIQTVGQYLRILNALVRDRGVYICTAENAGGISQSSAVVEVERREPPSVELHPSAPQTVISGGSALLQCRATGGIPSPRLKWSRSDGRPLSPSIEELSGGVLRFNQVTQAEAGEYMCHAENDVGQTSAVATLIVHSMPRITISPAIDVQATIGQRLRLECRATGEPQPTVEWAKHNRGYSFYDTQPVTGEEPLTAVYEITSVTKADEGSYRCLARNAAGTAEERLHITVDESNEIETGTPGGTYPRRGDIPGEDDNDRRPPYRNESIVLPEDEFRVPVGGRAEMRCLVKGNRERIFLNWIRADNMMMPQDHLIRDGILYINNVQFSDDGEYSCLGIGPTGSVLFTATARLVVVAPLRIQLNPTRQVVRPGDDALISCTATGEPPIDIYWSAVGRDLPRSSCSSSPITPFRGIAVSDAGRYLCRAKNRAGYEAEAVAEVIVSENPREPTVTAVQRDQSTYEGASVQLRCQVPPGPGRAPYITWTRDGAPLPANAVVRGEVLQLTEVQLSDQGRYICEAHSSSGVTSDYINLHVDRHWPYFSNLLCQSSIGPPVHRTSIALDSSGISNCVNSICDD
ncbi:hypothetical protein L9F63_020991, partial [Diploptera punctata]